MVRSLAVEALKLKGYRVLDAGDGREALRLAQGAGDIDLLITDVVMPRMTGRELADKLRHDGAAAPVLFMSGYPGSLGEQLGRNIRSPREAVHVADPVSRVRPGPRPRDVRAVPLKRAWLRVVLRQRRRRRVRVDEAALVDHGPQPAPSAARASAAPILVPDHEPVGDRRFVEQRARKGCAGPRQNR